MKSHCFQQATPKDFGIVRVTVFGLWMIILLNSPFAPYASLPPDLFEPLGVFRLIFPGTDAWTTRFFLSEPFLFTMKLLLLTGCTLCALGTRYFKCIAIPTVLLLFLADGITKGFNGFVNHAEMAILYSSLVLAIFPSADGFSVLSTKSSEKKTFSNYSLPIFFIAFTLCMAYTFVAVHRLLYGGLEQFFNHAMEIHLLTNTLNYSKFGFDWGLNVVSSPTLMILFKAGFFAVTLFELTSLFILFNRPFRFIWMGVMIPFHILSLFTMNIFFWENLVLIIVLFGIIAERNHKASVGKDGV